MIRVYIVCHSIKCFVKLKHIKQYLGKKVSHKVLKIFTLPYVEYKQLLYAFHTNTQIGFT